MPMTIRKDGSAISNSSQRISFSADAMRTPTTMSAGAVTFAVTTARSGEKIMLTPKKIATTTAVRPVRAPIAMPAEASTYAAVGVVPMTAPASMERESAMSARPMRGILPLCMKPACCARPMSVPAVSKKATRKKMTTTAHMVGSVRIAPICVTPTPKVGARDGAMEMMLSGGAMMPVTRPASAVMTMP